MKRSSRRAFLGLGLGAAATAGVSYFVRESDPQVIDASSLPPVPARMADELCASYLLNTKLFYNTQAYGHTDAVIELLTELGVRTVRERITTGSSQGALSQRRAMVQLADRGIRWHGTVGNLEDWPRAEAATAEVMRLLTEYYAPQVDGDLSVLMHSFGGCNEIDGLRVNGQQDPDWAQHGRVMQQALWQSAKSHPLTRDLPVAGPSTGTDIDRQGALELGDLSSICDWGNSHLYNKGTSPTRGLDEHLEILRRCFPDASHWIVSETGYNNSPQDNTGPTVPESASATYAVRGLCDFFRRGVMYGRFELLDDPDPITYSSQSRINATADRQAHFGLIAMTEPTVVAATPETWRKKPEFHAVQRLLALLDDPRPNFTPDGLRVTVTGGGPDLQQLLLQKHDGRHYLLLWRDVEVAEPYPVGRLVDVPIDRLTIHLGTERPLAVYSPAVQASPVSTTSATGAVTVDLAGDLLVAEIG